MTILQLRLRRQWQELLLCSHLLFPGTSDFLHLEKEYSQRLAPYLFTSRLLKQSLHSEAQDPPDLVKKKKIVAQGLLSISEEK